MNPIRVPALICYAMWMLGFISLSAAGVLFGVAAVGAGGWTVWRFETVSVKLKEELDNQRDTVRKLSERVDEVDKQLRKKRAMQSD